MNQNRISRVDPFRAMSISFLVVGAVTAAVILNYNGSGRLFEFLFAGHDDWGAQTPRFIRESAPEASGNHLMTFKTQEAPAAQTAVAENSTVATAEAQAVVVTAQPISVPSSWMRHIKGVLSAYSIHGPASQHSTASADARDVASAAVATRAAPAVAPTPAVSAPSPAGIARASYVNYGTTSRSDIMSAGAGPVYNFSGSRH